ncbi:helix-turn-helix transcriptional regulator [Streptomyces sp. 1331.2]|uniref:helix-turn-helix transcriptional regulator n=1 Tax=Streptomyces sp. 1331.2 TaxID=1938835 RepID=UPI000BD0621D|nr:helix-turn-helix transcriptional regulator [Streptomyces sp. 1331.2]SOB81331.1 Helix-turn-helix domain-containing protein [Streptomyces sp. 1331.2]
MAVQSAIKTRGELQVFLHRCRERAGVSQEDVAKQLHLSPRGYWNLEQGRIRNPSAAVLDELARLLELSPDERWRLYMLTVRHDPPPLDGATLDEQSTWADLLSMQACPAVIIDQAWQVVSANGAYQSIFHAAAPDRHGRENLLRQVLLAPRLRDTLLGDWDEAWATPLLNDLRTACEVYPDAEWPKALVRNVALDPRVHRLWTQLSTRPLIRPVPARPFRHRVWGPRVTVVETVPRYLAGYKILSFVPTDRHR